jgi:hypothetical protein
MKNPPLSERVQLGKMCGCCCRLANVAAVDLLLRGGSALERFACSWCWSHMRNQPEETLVGSATHWISSTMAEALTDL